MRSIATNELVLERAKVANSAALSPALAHEAEWDMQLDYTMNRMVIELRTELLRRPLGRIVYSFPATPWDHWKAAYLPRLGPLGRWYLRRHPIRESAKAFSAAATFPEATMVYPKELGRVFVALAPEFPDRPPSSRVGEGLASR